MTGDNTSGRRFVGSDDWARRPPMHIHTLIVDPSPLGREALKRALAATGLARFTFTEAATAEEALHLFDPGKVDLVFLTFEKQTSLGVAFSLVGELRLRQTRPLLIVALGSERSLERLQFADIDHFLVRPVQPQTLERQLGPLLERLGSAF